MANSVIRITQSDLATTAALGVNLTDAEIAAKLEAGPNQLTAKGSVSVSGVCVDNSGNIYVSDLDRHTILKIDEGGRVSLYAGEDGTSGDNGTLANVPALDARFNAPVGLACDNSGNIYVADSGNNQIRVIRDGYVSVLAGDGGGVAGHTDGVGGAAKFDTPWDVDVDPSGTVYVADSGNDSIRRIKDGTVYTYAGDTAGDGENVATTAKTLFDNPLGVACDANGNVFVCDTANYKIKKITPRGWVYLHSGSGVAGKALGTTAFNCQYNELRHCSVDASGNLYVIDANAANGTRLVKVNTEGIPAVINDFNGTTYNDENTAVAFSPAGKMFVVVYD